LLELDKEEKPTILVFNKIDAYFPIESDLEDENPLSPLEKLKKTWMARIDGSKCVFVSAHTKENIEELKELMYNESKEIFKVRYPYNDFLY
jgi:GTP-binding protein HflX